MTGWLSFCADGIPTYTWMVMTESWDLEKSRIISRPIRGIIFDQERQSEMERVV